ncbi:hypothetical protein ACWGMA_38250 [Streptomyces asiaticus]
MQPATLSSAVSTTHEVALQYPHLAKERAPAPDIRYAGGERPARLGIDYTSVHSALSGDRVCLTADARPVEKYIEEAASPRAVRPDDSGSGSMADPGTGPLVKILLTEDTRARQLIEALSAVPGD